jgi:hypothetical protein
VCGVASASFPTPAGKKLLHGPARIHALVRAQQEPYDWSPAATPGPSETPVRPPMRNEAASVGRRKRLIMEEDEGEEVVVENKSEPQEEQVPPRKRNRISEEQVSEHEEVNEPPNVTPIVRPRSPRVSVVSESITL